MNGRRAKALRRAVYGDASLRSERVYDHRIMKRSAPIPGAVPGLDGLMPVGMCVTTRNRPGSLRARYQAAKAASKK